MRAAVRLTNSHGARTAKLRSLATVSLATGGVTKSIAGTLDGGLDKYEYTVDFATDIADTLTQ